MTNNQHDIKALHGNELAYPGPGLAGGILLRLSRHVSGAVTPHQFDPAQDFPLIKVPVNASISLIKSAEEDS